MAVTLTVNITQNSQSVVNNTSNVTVNAVASWGGGSYNQTGECYGSIKIDGTNYSFTGLKFNASKKTSGSETVMTKTVNVNHNADGTKNLAFSASFYTGLSSSGTQTASATKQLTTIPRKSTLSVANGTLGTAQTLTITEKASSFTHKLYYTCGSSGTVYILGSSSATSTELSKSWTPPISLASQNTTDTSVSIKFTLENYSGTTRIGIDDANTKTFTIPRTLAYPSCSISVTDPTGLANTYGGFVPGVSKMAVTATPRTAYGSQITSYKITANGSTYTLPSFTTGVVKSGSSTISATVTDQRGYSGTTTATITVLNYKTPSIGTLSVRRCTPLFVDDDNGASIKVSFSSSGSTTIGSQSNTFRYNLYYKKSTDTAYPTSPSVISTFNDRTNLTLSDTAQAYLFAADTGSSYDIKLEVVDKVTSASKTTSASTAFTLLHFNSDGTGIGIGKVSEKPGGLTSDALLDIGMPTRFVEPVYGNAYGLGELPAIATGKNFNDYTKPGCYAVRNNTEAAGITNIPVAAAGKLVVENINGQSENYNGYRYIKQTYYTYNDDYYDYTRHIRYDGTGAYSYGSWVSSVTPISSGGTGATTVAGARNALGLGNTSGALPIANGGTGKTTAEAAAKAFGYCKQLWSGAYYMSESQSATLSEGVSSQPHGIVLVFSPYASGVINSNFNLFFVPKSHVSTQSGTTSVYIMADSNFAYKIVTKCLTISDTKITGHTDNDVSGTASNIQYNNARFVLRYVYGV